MSHSSSHKSLRFGLLLAAIPLLAACETLPKETAAATLPSDPEAQLAQIMEWWPGDYNNDAQLEQLAAQGKPIWRKDDTGKPGHIEVTSHYRAVDLPAFGENVLYVEETKHGEPGNIFRQRIYVLSVDEELDKVRVALWTFSDKEKYVGAYQDLSKLDGLTPDAMSTFGAPCDLITNPEGRKYHIAMNAKDCQFGENYFSYQVLLGPDSFWFRDKIAKVADDAIVSIAGGFTYHELDRID